MQDRLNFPVHLNGVEYDLDSYSTGVDSVKGTNKKLRPLFRSQKARQPVGNRNGNRGKAWFGRYSRSFFHQRVPGLKQAQ